MPGSGVNVRNTEGHTNPEGHGQTIEDLIDQFLTMTGDYDSQLQDAIDNIQATIDSIPPTLDIPSVSDVDVPGSSFPDKPVWGELNLSEYPDSTYTDPVLLPIGNVDFEYVAPTLPDDISPSFDWTSDEYSSEMYNALFNKVHSDILNGGTGLTVAVHASIVAREQEARRVNQDREYQRALNAVGSLGFNLPSGHVAAMQRDIGIDIIAKDQDSLNNIAIKDFDLATENTRFAITSGTELEKLARATWDAIEQRGLAAAKATSDYILAVYDANIKKYIAAWEGIKLDLEAIKMRVDAIVSANDGEIKIFLGKVSAYETEIKAISARNSGIIDTRKGEIDAYATEVGAASDEFEGLIKGMEAELKKSELEVQSAIAEGNLNLSVFTSKSELATQASTAIGKLTAQIIASTLGAINTSLSSGYSAGESKSESWSHGDTLSESHGFDNV